MEKFLEDIYEGYTFKDFKQFDRGVDGALNVLTLKEKRMIKDTLGTKESGICKLREVLGKKYKDEIQKEIELIESNMTEENEWDSVYLMHLYDFYMVI